MKLGYRQEIQFQDLYKAMPQDLSQELGLQLNEYLSYFINFRL